MKEFLYKYDWNVRNMGLGNAIWEIVRIYCWDSIPLTNRPAKVCILLAPIMLGTMVFIADYLGEVTLFMTKKEDLWQRMDTLEHFKESNMFYLVVNEERGT